MKKEDNQVKTPVLVVRDIVVFPEHSISLEVGRSKSLNAIEMALRANSERPRLIILGQKNFKKEDISKKEDLYEVGTLVEFHLNKETTLSKTITVIGIARVKVNNLEFKDDAIFAKFKVLKDTFSNQDENVELIKETDLINQISKKLEKVLGRVVDIPPKILETLSKGISASEISDIIGHYLPITFDRKQKILETHNVTKRLDLVKTFLEEEIQITNVDNGIDETVRKTLDDQQKEYILREKMKAIKEELGDISSKDNEVEEWKKELENNPKFPEDIKPKILEEIKKYESTPPISAEANVIKTYLDLVFKLPWKTYSTDNTDIIKAKEILEKHHYGLKKVKERIIEHLAVKMNTTNSHAPIITFVGPPGVGKTSLAKSIAEAIGREVVKVSLGGLRDESEIRGHRRTYVGSLPGKIIQAINKAKTSNPLILLDEIDKMASDYKGDPASAMLEVLDPEQNAKFQDHYLEVEYDLSQVMFIATANYYENIPSPLLDRVEIINLEQYTSEEKLQIAKLHIVPKAIEEHGLKKSQFKISDKIISYIIDKYTLEAGVRQLQKVMNKIARKIVVQKLEGKIKDQFTIDEDVVKEFLGKESIYKEKLKGKAEVGLVNGMYYSSAGGGVLPIEVTTYASKNGGIKLTGSVKEVMTESLNIAIGFIRANAKKFKIDFDFENNIIQVHIPEGAIPKDGPSAGTAFATAVISALLNKSIPKDIALTGEITLRGKVLPIGGLKEKTLGAVEAGVKKIFIPKFNKRDEDEFAQKVKDVAEIIFVENYSEIFEHIFLDNKKENVKQIKKELN